MSSVSVSTESQDWPPVTSTLCDCLRFLMILARVRVGANCESVICICLCNVIIVTGPINTVAFHARSTLSSPIQRALRRRLIAQAQGDRVAASSVGRTGPRLPWSWAAMASLRPLARAHQDRLAAHQDRRCQRSRRQAARACAARDAPIRRCMGDRAAASSVGRPRPRLPWG